MSHPAVFTSMFNVSAFLLDDAFWRCHWPVAWSMKGCDSLPHSVTFHKVV